MELILKLVICAGIIGLTTYLGILKSNGLRDREYILQDMITFLNLVENDIRYMMNILPNAYEMARQKLNTKLKIAIGKIVVDMINFNSYTMIEQSIEHNIAEITELTDYDKEIMVSTLKNLGRSDLDSQINIIHNSISILNNQLKEANDQKLKNSKLYRTIGIISGLLIVIVII